MSKTTEVSEYYGYSGNDRDLASTYRTARQAGYAAAMAANLHLIGNSERAALWEAEHQVWVERRDGVIHAAPLGGRWLAVYAAEVGLAAYETNAMSPAQLTEATHQP